jgi:hypothetical protein
VCGAVGAVSDSGAAGGRVSTDDAQALAGAEVLARWRSSRLTDGGRMTAYQDYERRATTIAGGEYVLCGLPLDHPITLVVSRNGQRSSSTSVRVTADAPVASSDLRVPKSFADAPIDIDSTKARLRLRVRNADGTAIPDAEVTLRVQAVSRTVRSENDGDAYFVELPPGEAEIGIRRIGSVAKTVRASIESGRNEMTVQLTGTVVVLAGARVIGNRDITARHAAVDDRIRAGDANHVVTRRDIERRNPIRLSQMLRTAAGVRVIDSAGVTLVVSTRGSALAYTPDTTAQAATSTGRGALDAYSLTPCVLRLMIDGILSSSSNVDQVMPIDVYAVEIFYGNARMPQQFAGIRNVNLCGLVAIWTR